MARSHKTSTWLTYLQSLTTKNYDLAELLNNCAAQFYNSQAIYPAFFHSIPLTYLLDYTTGRYLMFSAESKYVMGLDQGGFLEGGVDFMLHHYHPDHLRLFNEKIFHARLDFLKRIPSEQHSDYIFTYNHCFKDSQGNYTDLLQRNCFIKSDSNGNPLVSFGMIINHKHFSPGGRVIHTIEKIVQTEYGIYASLEDKKQFLLNVEDEELFSDREKEVLLWIADGLTSKEIANKLHVSEHTVINHRRHMQEKSNMPNATALISFAIRKGII